MSDIIKVGFCVAYDWVLLRRSLPLIYDHADRICLSLDRNRRSWSGNLYDFDEQAFRKFVNEMDARGIIDVYEDEFYDPALSPIQNDNRQRTMMAQRLGDGGWHIQVDSDEYFFDFSCFRQYLLSLNPHPTGKEQPLNVCCVIVPLIKKLENGYIFVWGDIRKQEFFPCATNRPEYTNARRNGYFNHVSPFFILHETWARGEEELLAKINNWGHVHDFESKMSYFNLWKSLDEFNFHYIRNFHPLVGPTWQQLRYVPQKEIPEIIRWLNNNLVMGIPKLWLLKINSRLYQGLKHRLRKF
jgi:hypothetical protein